MPNIISLVAEYAPERVRRTAVTTMFSGVPFGGFLGGLFARWLIPVFGWKSIFYLGGIVPIIIGLITLAALPESIRFLALRGTEGERIARIFRRIDPGFQGVNIRYVLPEERTEGLPVRELFRPGFALNTILLWIVFFMSLLIIYFTTNWLPTVLENAGLPLENAIVGTAAFHAGSVIGSIIIGSAGDRFNAKKVLGCVFFLGAIALALVGYAGGLGVTMLVISIVGFLCVGGQSGINALAAVLYPTSARSTGVGWALGVGRLGSIVGPLIGGIIIAMHWTLQQIYLLAAVPALIASGLIMCMRLKGGPADIKGTKLPAEVQD